MSWFILSVISSFTSAVAMIIRKAVVKVKGLESSIGMIKFLAMGLFLGAIHALWADDPIDTLLVSAHYWQLISLHTVLEMLAFWCLLRAMHYAEVTYIGPMLAGSTILVMLAAIPILGEIPSLAAALGVLVIIGGIVMINYDPGEGSESAANNRVGMPFLAVTIVCWTFTPIIRKMALEELTGLTSDAPLFMASSLSIFIAIGFAILALIMNEYSLLKDRLQAIGGSSFLALTIGGSLVYSLSLWSHYAALGLTHTAYAVVIKDTAPIFAFGLSYALLNERERLGWKLSATIATLLGSALVAFG